MLMGRGASGEGRDEYIERGDTLWSKACRRQGGKLLGSGGGFRNMDLKSSRWNSKLLTGGLNSNKLFIIPLSFPKPHFLLCEVGVINPIYLKQSSRL